MADKKPIKATYSGTDTNGLAEFVAADTIGVADGGTGLTTVATSNLLTGNGASALSAEANLTFDGTNLTMGTGNLIVGTSGKGIDFSATSDGSTAQSELLDDYEEGYYTPTISGHTTAGSWTMYSSTNSLAYIKVGHVCTVRGYIEFSNVTGSPAGNMQFSLPFANKDASGSAARDQGLGLMQLRSVGDGTSVNGGYACHTGAGSSTVTVRGQVNGGTPFYMQTGAFAANERGFWVTLTYFTGS